MAHTHITLRVQTRFFDDLPASLFDEERVSIIVSIGGLIDLLVGELPQQVQKPCRQQLAVFLERVCEAGDEADLMREYLGDLIKMCHDRVDFPQALSDLTGKNLLIKTDVWSIRKWTRLAVAALDEPYVTQLVVATLLLSYYSPGGSRVDRFHNYFLSLLK